jgi:hypothetical protein
MKRSVAEKGRRRRRDLVGVKVSQVKCQSALRSVEASLGIPSIADDNILDIGGVATGQCGLERIVGRNINQTYPRLEHAFGVRAGLVGIKRFIAVVQLRRGWSEGIHAGFLRSESEAPKYAITSGWCELGIEHIASLSRSFPDERPGSLGSDLGVELSHPKERLQLFPLKTPRGAAPSRTKSNTQGVWKVIYDVGDSLVPIMRSGGGRKEVFVILSYSHTPCRAFLHRTIPQLGDSPAYPWVSEQPSTLVLPKSGRNATVERKCFMPRHGYIGAVGFDW